MSETKKKRAQPPQNPHRNKMIILYHKVNPEKLADVDALLKKFEGDEDTMWRSLRKKYGDEAVDKAWVQSASDGKVLFAAQAATALAMEQAYKNTMEEAAREKEAEEGAKRKEAAKALAAQEAAAMEGRVAEEQATVSPMAPRLNPKPLSKSSTTVDAMKQLVDPPGPLNFLPDALAPWRITKDNIAAKVQAGPDSMPSRLKDRIEARKRFSEYTSPGSGAQSPPSESAESSRGTGTASDGDGGGAAVTSPTSSSRGGKLAADDPRLNLVRITFDFDCLDVSNVENEFSIRIVDLKIVSGGMGTKVRIQAWYIPLCLIIACSGSYSFLIKQESC